MKAWGGGRSDELKGKENESQEERRLSKERGNENRNTTVGREKTLKMCRMEWRS